MIYKTQIFFLWYSEWQNIFFPVRIFLLPITLFPCILLSPGEMIYDTQNYFFLDVVIDKTFFFLVRLFFLSTN